jgi:predicted NUDIX family NTP pyrophosphohydrolase
MPRASAGLLCYRRDADGVKVFLAHPGGPFWARKDEGAWSIPKGEIDDDEDPERAARREFEEETGCPVTGPLVSLGSIRQGGGKWVHVWAFEGDIDPASVRSNTFTLEWPPRSGRVQAFPEVDRVDWFSIEKARRKILTGQRPLLDRLVDYLSVGRTIGSG